MSVRVGIDGMNLAIPRGTGVATYARSLGACVRELGHPVDLLFGMHIRRDAPETHRDFTFFDQLQHDRGYRRPKYPSPGWAKAMLEAWRGDTAWPVPITGRVETRPFGDRLPAHDRLLNVDRLFGLSAHYFRVFNRFMTVRIPDPPAIMHWTYPIPVRVEGAHNIYTVHDLVPLRMPYMTLDHKPSYFRLIATCLARGDHVCTVSEASRTDVMRFFPHADPQRITNTYESVALRPGEMVAGSDEMILRGYNLSAGRYFLFFGSIEPKKNVGRLLQAFAGANVGMPLVLVTARGWQSEAEAAVLRDRDPHDPTFKVVEYVPTDILSALIRGARAVTFPSLHEGFGLPVLEAMQEGTPVMTSREGSLAEVAGEAAVFTDAYDIADMAAGLRRLATDDSLCRTLRERGPVQARLFSMEKYRDRVQAMYAAVIAQPRRG